jgi:transposase
LARNANGKTAARLLALAFVLEGCSRAEAARRCGMDRQTLRDWVIRYNEQGVGGLSDRPHRGGTPAKLSDEEKAQLANWLRQGPDLAEDGVVRWRLSDLRQRLFERMFVMLDKRSVGRIVTALGFSHVSVRPRNPKANEDDQAAHKKTSSSWSMQPFPPMRATSRSNCGGRMKPGSVSRAA